MTGIPPCAVDPDRWFDGLRRVETLVTCLQCPTRRQCAGEALRAGASEGMWAGVWIDGDHEPAVRWLQAIAADWPPPRRAAPPSPNRAPARRAALPLPRRRPLTRCSVTAAVDARASGHCEVMAPGCRLSGDRHLSRVPGRDPAEATSAAEVFSACSPCAEMVCAETDLMRQHGFVVVSTGAAARTPVHWRAARWVLLGRAGELTEVDTAAADAQSA